jgi:hypothetical protein
MTLRKSIRKSVIEQSKLLDSIGTVEMVQKQVLTVAKKTLAAMSEKTDNVSYSFSLSKSYRSFK